MSTKKLIVLADLIISQTSVSEDGIDLVEQYVTQFSLWHDSYQESPTEVDATDLEALAAKHTAVLAKARQWKLDTAGNLAQTRKKGKGMKAYIDTLPKRISLKRSKRG